MGLDLRFPLGIMFGLVGLILAVYGLMTGSNVELYKCSLGININLVWGSFLLVFGIIMLAFAVKGAKADQPKP